MVFSCTRYQTPPGVEGSSVGQSTCPKHASAEGPVLGMNSAAVYQCWFNMEFETLRSDMVQGFDIFYIDSTMLCFYNSQIFNTGASIFLK